MKKKENGSERTHLTQGQPKRKLNKEAFIVKNILYGNITLISYKFYLVFSLNENKVLLLSGKKYILFCKIKLK